MASGPFGSIQGFVGDSDASSSTDPPPGQNPTENTVVPSQELPRDRPNRKAKKPPSPAPSPAATSPTPAVMSSTPSATSSIPVATTSTPAATSSTATSSSNAAAPVAAPPSPSVRRDAQREAVRTDPETTANQPVNPFLANPDSLAAHLRSGTIGNILDALRVISPEHRRFFKLPQVVVVGDECEGISSLLESVTKCPVFPRDISKCTKMPIRLRLLQVANKEQAKIVVTCEGQPERQLPLLSAAVDAVKEMMAVETSALPAEITLLSDKEIVVTIKDPEVPTVDCVDLPGIRQGGERQDYERMVNRYLNSECVILCAVDANKPSLSTVATLALVEAAGLNAKTILVLTKADTVTTLHVKPYIVDRLLYSSADIRGRDAFAGCFAVTNRSTVRSATRPRDETLLEDATAEEAAHFEHLIFNNSEIQYALDNLPPGTDRALHERQIRSRITVPNLLKCLEVAFKDYIVRVWKQDAMRALESDMTATRDAIFDLGLPVERLSVESVMQELCRQIDTAELCRDIQGIHVRVGPGISRQDPNNPLYPPQRPRLENQKDTSHPWGTPPWAKETLASGRLVQKACHNAISVDSPDSDTLRKLLLSAVDAAFTAPAANATFTGKLARFDTLRVTLAETVVPELFRTAMQSIEDFVDRAVNALIDESYGKAAKSPARYRELQEAFTGCVICHVMDVVEELSKGVGIPAGFKLEENDETERERSRLNEKVAKLAAAKEVLRRFLMQQDI